MVKPFKQLGHGKDRCTRTPVCVCVCVRFNKSDAYLTNGEQDPNRGKNTADSKDCKMWKKEKEILRIKYTQNIPFPEARKIVEATKYADVSKKNIPNTSIFSCQKCKTAENTPINK